MLDSNQAAACICDVAGCLPLHQTKTPTLTILTRFTAIVMATFYPSYQQNTEMYRNALPYHFMETFININSSALLRGHVLSCFPSAPYTN